MSLLKNELIDVYLNKIDNSNSIRIESDEKSDLFLIIDGNEFIKNLNSWLNENYADDLEKETGHKLSDNYDLRWLDYLTDGLWGYSDEYVICSNCGKVIRYTPDNAIWTPNYWITNGNIFCTNCIKEHFLEDYLESLKNNPKKANVILSSEELAKEDYVLMSDIFFSDTDTPEEIYKKEYQKDPDSIYIFNIVSNYPFCTEYNLWKKKTTDTFEVIDYFDVWGNEIDGWEINNSMVVKQVELPIDISDKEVIKRLIKCEYLSNDLNIDNIFVWWSSDEFCELFENETGKPICCLRKI